MSGALKFKVGDTAKVVKCTQGHEFEIGSIVRIVNKSGNDYEARLLDDYSDYWFLVDEELEAVTVQSSVLPTDASTRKAIPIVSGAFDYFPAALAEVAKLSKVANDQHNPGEPMHWARGKSNDHADCIGRHLAERGTIDTDGQRHSTKIAWRALALLQMELEAEGAPMARGAR